MPAPGPIEAARAYWDAAAETYEQDFSGTLTGGLQRQAVWRMLDRLFRPGQRVLELNCGTGIDALHLANRGIHVTACDLSPRMIKLAARRIEAAHPPGTVSLRALPIERIGELSAEAPFDGGFSNFSGLNCVPDLQAAARDLSSLLRPGARFLACMVGRFVPWEIAWFLAHGDPKNAVRRLRNRLTPDDVAVRVQCPSIREIAVQFAPAFRLRRRGGVGILLPPTYLEAWARRFPRLTHTLAAVDHRIEAVPLLRSAADCMVLEFERSAAGEARHAGA